jgi:SAM-dependent methyltransferase
VTACPYCGAAAHPRYSAGDYNQRITAETFRYLRCGSCQLTFIERIPENLGRYYANEQYSLPSGLDEFRPRAQAQRWKVDLLRSVLPRGDLLEIGPATGEFAFAAREAGFNPTVFEMDANCARFIREVLGIKVVQTGDPASRLEGTFDVICLWQAIEHVPVFWQLMEKALPHIRPGGVLLMSTPNPDSLQARILRHRWPHLDAPRHLYLIPIDWMRAFGRKHGLATALATTRDEGSTGLNYYGWLLAARNERWAGRITRLLRPWEQKEGNGASYTIAFRKA